MSLKLNQEVTVSFQAERMYMDLMTRATMILIETANEMYEIQANLIMKSRSEDAVNATLDSLEKIIDLGGEELTAIVGSDNWKAFLVNYGKGSTMADISQNPYLSKYKSMPAWNKFRDNFDKPYVVTRTPGEIVTVPDWDDGDGWVQYHVTHNFKPGQNLERDGWSWAVFRKKIRPIKPQFFIEKSVEQIRGVFKERLEQMIDEFPFSDYLIIK